MQKIRWTNLLTTDKFRTQTQQSLPEPNPDTNKQENGTTAKTVPLSSMVKDDPLAHQLMVRVQSIIESRQSLKDELLETRKELTLSQQQHLQVVEEKKALKQQVKRLESQLHDAHEENTRLTLKLDQVVEDFQKMKDQSRQEIEALKKALRSESDVHQKMLKELEEVVIGKDKQIFGLERMLKEQENRYQKLLGDFQKIEQDNQRLIEHISGFAKQSLGSVVASHLPLEENLSAAPIDSGVSDSSKN